jgi:drug/metabolite transporter (DMT)-like permease
MRKHPAFDAMLAWYFVLMWGGGFVATKAGLQHAAPFTFLFLRFCFGIAVLALLLPILKPMWPQGRRVYLHLIVAGVLMHAVHLSGSHYGQYLGLSAGIVALLLALQPIITAVLAHRYLSEPLAARQWIGVALGLVGVALVVWHKIDVAAMTPSALLAISIALAAITAATLYQRRHCAHVDLNAASMVQFVASAVFLLPFAAAVEGFQVRWHPELFLSIAILVIGASILAVNALHTLMRQGEATRVTSLIYLTPVVAVATEWLVFAVVPTLTSVIGGAVVCAGVALVSWRAREKASAGTGGSQ